MAFSCSCCDDPLPANTTLQRFDARYFHLDFPLTAIATIVADTPDKLVVNCEFRSNRDLVGMLWTSKDLLGHDTLQYVEDRNYSGVKLGFVANPPNPYAFTVTVTTRRNAQVYRLYPYKVDGSSLVPDVGDPTITGVGPGTTYAIADIFPGGMPTVPSGSQVYILNFDDLRLGYNYEGALISPLTISQLFFSLTPPDYGLGAGARVGNVGRLDYTPDGEFFVYGTGDLVYWEILDANPNVRLKRGDMLLLSISQPSEMTGGGGKGGKDTPMYSILNQLVNAQVNEWYWDSGKLYVKVVNGPINGVAFIGGPATASNLQLDTAIGSYTIQFTMEGISVTGARATIGRKFYPQPAHNMQMTSGYDDTYNITPWRQVDNTYNLGYRGHFNIYMGMSHYFKASSTGGNTDFICKVTKDAAEPLNYPTQVWCRNLFEQMQAYGYVFIWSTSFEILNTYCPEEWRQEDYLGRPALSGWVPPSSFLIPTNMEAMEYLAKVIRHGLKLLDESGISTLMFQIGEPWWWDGSYSNGAPCIYDDHTTALYTAETGNPVPTPLIQNFMEPVTPTQRPYLEWLGVKLGEATNYIRDSVKAVYPDSLATLLFFTPQIMNPQSEMLTIINFPMSEWVYPNYDFVQIEDYDWIINGQLDLLPQTLEAATVLLGYPLSVVHYFVGFVNTARETWVWPSINIATKLAILNGIPNIYVWAYPQVIRDAITYDDTLYGTQPAIQPPVPSRRQLPPAIEGTVLRPVFFVQIGDDIFMNSSDRNIVWSSQTWYATGRFGKIEPMVEGIDKRDSGWSMSLTNLPLIEMDSVVDSLRTKKVTLLLGLFDDTAQLITDPRIIGEGRIIDNNVRVENNAATITLNVRSKSTDWHKASSARYTDEYQQLLHPGDRGMMFIGNLQQTKLQWGDQNA